MSYITAFPNSVTNSFSYFGADLINIIITCSTGIVAILIIIIIIILIIIIIVFFLIIIIIIIIYFAYKQ